MMDITEKVQEWLENWKRPENAFLNLISGNWMNP